MYHMVVYICDNGPYDSLYVCDNGPYDSLYLYM